MTLVQDTLFGVRDKVAIAIDRLCQFEPPEGYHLAFSGGKDSVTILRLAQMAQVKFDAHYQITTVDPPELYKFIKEQYPEVERHRPEMSMFRLIIHKKRPPTRLARFCCEALKERGGAGRIVMTGIRWEESPRRAKRRMVQTCYKDETKTYLSPIIDWTTEDVWQFIGRENVPYCSLYDEGFDRLGCVLCPMQCTQWKIEKEMARWPQFVDAYTRTFERMIAARQKQGLKISDNWQTGEAVFDWWIDRRRRTQYDEAQLVLFE